MWATAESDRTALAHAGGEEQMLAMSSENQAGGIDYAHTDGWGNSAPGTDPSGPEMHY